MPVPISRRNSVTRLILVPGALALALCAIPQARAATDADLAQIRDEIRSLRQAYEARIEALEQRLDRKSVV
jgi:hypothetical protein